MPAPNTPTPLKKPVVISYLVIFLILLLVGCLHLATPFITVLFCYLLLNKLSFFKRKWVAIVCFLILISAVFYGFSIFVKLAVVELPKIVSMAVPKVVAYANQHHVDLPFTDLNGLKDMAMESVNDTLGYLTNFAKLATKEFALLVMGLVIAIGVFVNPELDHERNVYAIRPNLYSHYCALISDKFSAFYRSFERVMGAQLIISLINTGLTAIFVYSTSLRYAGIVVALTFICGLLPIIGNIISNIIIVGIAFTVSPKFAFWSLMFLILVHKLEYFLNSQIIGSRIRHPMWLMLLALILGERLMGIPGIILAPVILNFVKTEAIQIPVEEKPDTGKSI